jgi:hypothetical protein
MNKPSPRLFIKVDAEWVERFDAYCANRGMTRSGAVRAALEGPMRESEKGKLSGPPKWNNMSGAMKSMAIRACDRAARTYDVSRTIVERFAYRNGLLKAAE